MTERVTVRVGPESAVLVLGTGRDRVREAAGDLGRELVPSVLGPQVILLPSGALAGVVAHEALGLGTGGAVALVGALLLLELLVCALLVCGSSLTRPCRLELSPPHAPVRMRFVRLGRTGRWRPVAELGGLEVVHRVQEPVDGDPRPRAETFTVSAAGRRRASLSAQDVPGDPRELVRQLGDLLAPAGVPVGLRTTRYARRLGRPPVRVPGPAPAGAAPAEAVPADAGPVEAAPAEATPADGKPADGRRGPG
ncbi:hypothetical protein ACFCX4_24695 [Kitasatospora sp. NPDC056327]|uniref:hypothetical protein n=1 Tax=Kitasatospora sp. NPDC056327 TaxID=3345785 RepID=UPI0035DA97C5